jgi:hypothetical protein
MQSGRSIPEDCFHGSSQKKSNLSPIIPVINLGSYSRTNPVNPETGVPEQEQVFLYSAVKIKGAFK